MKLVALLCWYDEPPAWLAATITSLTRIGVDTLIAVDGAYAHFPDGTARSDHTQAEAIQLACDAADIELVMHQPNQLWWGGQVEKRSAMFNLAAAVTTPHEDWLFVVDADEVITQGTPAVKEELANTTADTASIHLWQWNDPAKTPELEAISQKHDTPNTHSAMTRRFYRCMTDMRCEHAHSVFTATTTEGHRVSLRNEDVAEQMGLPAASHYDIESQVWVQHREKNRDKHRRRNKAKFYALRTQLGIEDIPKAHPAQNAAR